ncbi:MAG: hypothetical protein ACYSU7_16625 [Planctomycetota bacterium]|jgi:hypothetical protein
MSWGQILIAGIIVFSIVETLVILWAVVHFGWSPIHKKFPTRAPDAEAVTRSYQSFKVGILNLGFSVHVAVDEHFLHLTPAAYLRGFGAGTLSIPWEAITVEKRSRSGRWITIKIDKWTIMGPAWCLELAEKS